MEISVANRQRKASISSKHVRLIACSVLEAESACFDEISIAFIGARAMRRLNRRYAGRDTVTDTLAFELAPEPVKKKPVAGKRIGEVIVCVEKAIEQSKRYRVSLKKEVARLLIHGLLHLSGFEDKSRSGRSRMKRREDHYISSLGNLISLLIRSPRKASPSGRFERRGT